jgi:hypothetical protein
MKVKRGPLEKSKIRLFEMLRLRSVFKKSGADNLYFV